MKIKWLMIIVLLTGTPKIFAQSTAVDHAQLVVKALNAQNYGELEKLTDPKAAKSLTVPVFKQIREVIIRRNEAPNKFVDPQPVDSITALALKMIKEMSVQKTEDGVETGAFEVISSGDLKLVKAEIPKTFLNLVMGFNNAYRLTQFYLEPVRPKSGNQYKDAAYVDSTLYEQKQIFVQTGAFVLPGTLTVPKGKKNFPILVFVHGSGPGDRDEGLYALKPFRDIALGLAVRGIASLRYDKRTRIYRNAAALIGKISTIKDETTDDARSAIKLAGTVAGVDVKRIYLLGHSLGGMMTPAIVTENPKLAGAIILSGPSRSFVVSIEDQIRNNKEMGPNYIKSHLKEIEMISHADTIADQSVILIDQTAAFWAGLKHYDQLEVVKKLKQPLLILQGERDYQVPFSDLALWEAALKNKSNVITKSYSKLNHFYSEGEGPGRMNEYFVPGNVPLYVVEDIVSWILKKK